MSEGKTGLRIWERNASSTKMIVIAVIALLLMIPTVMIERLINEREGRKAEVTREIGSKWGQEQTVTGPVVRVPYLERVTNAEVCVVVSRREINLLP